MAYNSAHRLDQFLLHPEAVERAVRRVKTQLVYLEPRGNVCAMRTRRVYPWRASKTLRQSELSFTLTTQLTFSAISSPPRKRPRALLMPPGNDSVPSENRFQWKDKKRKAFDAATLPDDIVGNGTVAETEDGEDGQTGTEYEPSEVETEEDELAAMVSSLFIL